MSLLKIGVLEEGKIPPDERVPFLPEHCKQLMDQYPCEVVVQRSKVRRMKDAAYEALGIRVVDDVSECDILFGVKEVPIDRLLPYKTYFFFSHTIKKQAHNRKLLQAVLEKKIRLIDYECLVDANGSRIIGFGRYAGIVGTYNGFRMIGDKTGQFKLPPAHTLHDREELLMKIGKIKTPPLRICLTGTGRVAHGAFEVLNHMGIRQVTVEEYLNQTFHESVYVDLTPLDYNKRMDGAEGSMDDFVHHPEFYEGNFRRFLPKTDLYLACHFWSKESPVFFTAEDMKRSDFALSYIADISCDIDGPIPSTLRASTIPAPFYGVDKSTNTETDFSKADALAVMAIDNLPCELPLDASLDFGNQLLSKVTAELFNGDAAQVLHRATIAKDGQLTDRFRYLEDYVKG